MLRPLRPSHTAKRGLTQARRRGCHQCRAARRAQQKATHWCSLKPAGARQTDSPDPTVLASITPHQARHRSSSAAQASHTQEASKHKPKSAVQQHSPLRHMPNALLYNHAHPCTSTRAACAWKRRPCMHQWQLAVTQHMPAACVLAATHTQASSSLNLPAAPTCLATSAGSMQQRCRHCQLTASRSRSPGPATRAAKGPKHSHPQ